MPAGGRVDQDISPWASAESTSFATKRPREQRRADDRPRPHGFRRPLGSGPSSGSGSASGTTSTPSSSKGRASRGSFPSQGPGSRSHAHGEGGVRVVVRVRPLSPEEEEGGAERIMRCCSPKSLEFLDVPTGGTLSGFPDFDGDTGLGAGSGDTSRGYSFDLCAHEGFSQEEMFRSCGLMALLSAAVDGYAGTVFAYGATGAGKTYTMSGMEQVLRGGGVLANRFKRGSRAKVGRGTISGGTGDTSMDGLVPRSMRFLFDKMNSLRAGLSMRVRASFYEIYNECVYDLLAQGERRPLQVRYDAKRGFFVQGLLEVEIRGLDDIMAVVDEGNGNRRVSSHLLNKDSSRSHSLLSVHLHGEWKDPEDGHLVRTFGKVTFVDLAGSERLKKSKAANERETASINKSLMTLGKVISALSRRSAAAAAASAAASGVTNVADEGVAVDQRSSTAHGGGSMGESSATSGGAPSASDHSPDIWVPYRDSTLTKLLMDSLGGNGLTLMVACVSPSTRHAEESAATLNYAARARNIRNRPLVRIDARERVINALRREINLLREENELLRVGNLAAPPGAGCAIATSAPGAGDRAGAAQGWLEPSSSSNNAKKLADAGRETNGGESPAGTSEKQQQQDQQREQADAHKIGQASRDVAVLLRKYEGECHRLRNEAAMAQHKELEIGKQTRQALIENEALSRTVERLQKTFANDVASKAHDVAGVADGAGDIAAANSGVQQKTLSRENPLMSAQQEEVTSAPSPPDAPKLEGDKLSAELMHLRRVNEALVDRMESMERNNLAEKAGRCRKIGPRKSDGQWYTTGLRGPRVAAARGVKKDLATAGTDRLSGHNLRRPVNAPVPPPGRAGISPTRSLAKHRSLNSPEPDAAGRTVRGEAENRTQVRRDPRGRLILRGLQVDGDNDTAAGDDAKTRAVQARGPPPGRLVGDVRTSHLPPRPDTESDNTLGGTARSHPSSRKSASRDWDRAALPSGSGGDEIARVKRGIPEAGAALQGAPTSEPGTILGVTTSATPLHGAGEHQTSVEEPPVLAGGNPEQTTSPPVHEADTITSSTTSSRGEELSSQWPPNILPRKREPASPTAAERQGRDAAASSEEYSSREGDGGLSTVRQDARSALAPEEEENREQVRPIALSSLPPRTSEAARGDSARKTGVPSEAHTLVKPAAHTHDGEVRGKKGGDAHADEITCGNSAAYSASEEEPPGVLHEEIQAVPVPFPDVSDESSRERFSDNPPSAPAADDTHASSRTSDQNCASSAVSDPFARIPAVDAVGDESSLAVKAVDEVNSGESTRSDCSRGVDSHRESSTNPVGGNAPQDDINEANRAATAQCTDIQSPKDYEKESLGRDASLVSTGVVEETTPASGDGGSSRDIPANMSIAVPDPGTQTEEVVEAAFIATTATATTTATTPNPDQPLRVGDSSTAEQDSRSQFSFQQSSPPSHLTGGRENRVEREDSDQYTQVAANATSGIEAKPSAPAIKAGTVFMKKLRKMTSKNNAM